MTKLGRQTNQSAQVTKNRIKLAALALFAEKGFDAISLREISRNAGVSHGLIRYHFGTKDDIWNTVFEDRFNYFVQLRERLIKEDLKNLPANEIFFQIAIYFALTLLNSPLLIKLINREASNKNPKIQKFIENGRAFDLALQDLFKQVQALGYLTHFTVNEYTTLLNTMTVMPNISAVLTQKLLMNIDDKSDQGMINYYIQAIIKIFAPLLGIDPIAFIESDLPQIIETIAKRKQLCADLY